MSGAEVVGIISAIIAIIDATIKVSNAVKDEAGLPTNFKAAAIKLPLITKLLDDAERYIASSADDVLASAFTPVLINCEKKVTQLQHLFNNVCPAETDSRIECYVKAARTIGKGGRVETLMTEILNNLQLLATKFPEAMSRRGRENLEQAIDEVKQLEPSLSDGFEHANFAHYGSGAQNTNSGIGTQYNNTGGGNQNNGSGNQFIGTNHIVLRDSANEDVSISKTSHFIVPFARDSLFVARPSIQRWVHEQFSRNLTRMALIGMGGFGKSQIAIEVAHEVHRSDLKMSVFWVYGNTRATFEESYQSLADKLALPHRYDPKVNVLALVRNWLQREDVAPWLIILDSADDSGVFLNQTEGSPLASYLPKTGNGKILVTSRNRDVAEKLVGSHRAIKNVPAMDCTEALLLLQRKLDSSIDDDIAATHLVCCLDYIPLAIHQATAYINRNYISINTYIQRFQNSDKQRTRLLRHDGGDIRRHEGVSNSIAITWQVTFDQILQENPHAANLLFLLSCFQPKNIPRYMLSGYNDSPQNDKLGNSDDETLEDDMGVLFAYSLIRPTAELHSCEMHALVQVCTRAWLSELGHAKYWEELFLRLASKNFPNGFFDTWRKCQQLLPHVDRLSEHQPNGKVDILNWALLLAHISFYIVEKGNYKKGIALAQKSLKARTELLGRHHLDTILNMSNLADAFKKNDQWKEAESLQRQILQICIVKVGPDHPDTLTIMSDLASTLMGQCQWQDAEKLQVQILQRSRKTYGLDHYDTLTSMAHLGSIIWHLGRCKEAEALHAEAMKIIRTKSGTDRFDTLVAMPALASAFMKQAQWRKAERLQVQILQRSETELEAYHPFKIRHMSDLATAIYKQERYAEAEKLQVQVLEIRKTSLGADHPFTLDSMSTLAFIVLDQGRLKEAERLQAQVVEIYKRQLGADHPSTLHSMSNLASILLNQDRWEEAERLGEQAMELGHRKHGVEHLSTLKSMMNLARAIAGQGRWQEAERLELQVLELLRIQLEAPTPSTLDIMEYLAQTIRSNGRLGEALALMDQCVLLRAQVLGLEHPETISSARLVQRWRDEIDGTGKDIESDATTSDA